jgi:SHO1 osmosensor
MESQPLEQPAQEPLQEPSRRPQSSNINAISRSSIAERIQIWNLFLALTFLIGFSSWTLSLVSQAVVASTSREDNAMIRPLWFGIVIQFILLVEILEVVLTGLFAYGVQISIFAGLATVFAVLGADQYIYASSGTQKAIGAGWLITAIIDLLWIIYFTSPNDSHFIRLASTLLFPRRSRSPKTEKILRSRDAFVMSPPNGANNAGPGAEPLGLDDDRLKKEGIQGPERTSGYDLNHVELERGTRIKSGGLWSSHTPTTPPARRTTISSVATNGAQGIEREGSARGSVRERSVRRASGMTGASAPSQEPPYSKPTSPRHSRTAQQPVSPVQTQPVDE